MNEVTGMDLAWASRHSRVQSGRWNNQARAARANGHARSARRPWRCDYPILSPPVSRG